MCAQTTVQNANKIQFGSGKLEYSTDDGSTWTDVGAMRNIVFTESWEQVKVDSDNAGRVKTGIRNQIATIAGNLMEINLANLDALRGGLDTYTTDEGVSETLSSGGNTSQDTIRVRVTHTTEDDEEFRITLYKAVSVSGIEIAFQSDEADDVNVVPISIEGEKDTTRDVGDQLFELYSELGEAAAS
jgi:FlaG/FlaF family flagellin (archaellin)